jgi:hypothetical protein
MKTIVQQSTITCPHCGYPKEETMPINACQYFYTCTGCSIVLKPKPGIAAYFAAMEP